MNLDAELQVGIERQTEREMARGVEVALGDMVKTDYLDFRTISSGETIKVMTEDGHDYYLTRVNDFTFERGWHYGVSIVTSSPTFLQIMQDPRSTGMKPILEVGGRIELQSGGRSAAIVRILVAAAELDRARSRERRR